MQCLESTEAHTTSSAFERLKQLIATAEAKSYASGEVLLDPTAVPIHLKRWMQEAGYQTIAERLMLINFSIGEEDFLTMLKQWRVHIKLLQPLVVGTEASTQEEYEALYDQMILEMMSPHFCGTWSVVEVCGCKH